MTDFSGKRARWLAEHVLPHEPALRAWLAHRLHGRSGAGLEVDDVVQETYAVLARLGDVSHVRNPRAYVFTTAQSVVLQQLRRSRIVAIETVAEIDRLDVAHEQRSPERCAVAHQELRHIGELIAGLPPKCRQAFILRKVHGLSQREIARHMSISESTVEKHIGKGLRVLMDALGKGSVGQGCGGAAATQGRNRHDRKKPQHKH